MFIFKTLKSVFRQKR